MTSPRLLVNALTLDRANLVPLLAKLDHFKSKGCEITLWGAKPFRDRLTGLGKADDYRFLDMPHAREFTTMSGYVRETLGRNLAASREIRKLRGQFHLVYSISSVLDLTWMPWLFKGKDPAVRWCTVMDNTVPFWSPGNPVIRFAAWLAFRASLLLLKRADRIFAISEALKKDLVGLGCPEDRLVVTGNAVEGDLIRASQPDPRYRVDALFVGRINEAKGIGDLLQVIQEVKKRFPNFQLALMGHGDAATEAKYKEEIRQRGLEQNTQWLGHREGPEKYDILKSSKIFVFLSATESFGVALLEAVCSGLPCFAYDLPAFRSIYQDHEVTLFNQGDWPAVARKIIETFEKGDFENLTGKALLDRYGSWAQIAETEYQAVRPLL